MKHRRASLRVVAAIVFVTLGLVGSGLPAQGAPPADPTVTSPTKAQATPPPTAPVTLPTPPEVQAALDDAQPAPSEPAPSLDDTQLVTPPDLGPAPQGAEIVDRRTATTKTFATDRPGEFVTEMSSDVIHYQADGHWQDIDTELVAGKDGRLHNKAGAFDLSVATSATDASIARLGLDATHSVGFSLEGATNAKGKATEEATTFSGARKDTQLRLTSRPNGLKEELVLASAAAPDRFVFPLQLKGLTASIDGDGNVIYRDEAGVERARTPHGYMYDANVDPRSGEAPTSFGVHFALIASGKGGTALEVTLDRAWLDDPARQYPVVVDPEFVTATGADDTYVMSNIAPNSAASETELKVGTYDGGTHVARAFLHFNTAPISGKVIQWGRLDIAERHSYNCANVGPTPYRVTQTWTGSGLTSWPGAAIDIPAGGALNAVSGSCPNRLFSADMNGASANWASGAWNNLGIALVAPSESNSNYYKRFASFDSGAPPALHVGWTEPTATVPSAPQSLVATARNLSASVTWAAPASNGGAAVDNYIVYAYNYPAGTPAGPYSYACGTCTSTTVAGLTNGQQYYFAAYAHNAIGWGAVAGSNVVVPAPQPPTPPQSPLATPRNTSAIVSWAPPANNGGSAILDYYVFIYPYPSMSPATYVVACATCTSVNVPNLTNGQQYIFGIYARNAVNFSTGVATNIVTPAVTVPNAPATVIASPASTSATVAWSAPTDNGGAAITASYAMAYTLNPLTYANKFVQVCAMCTSGTVTGLTNGVAYQFLAFASNSAGNGAFTWSNVVTPGGSPTVLAATSVVAARGDTQAHLTWAAPVTNLLLPVTYTITTNSASDNAVLGTMSVPATQAATVTATVAGLVNGAPVYFRVTATTLVFLTGPPSLPSNTVTPAGAPVVPSSVYADPADRQAIVHWQPSGDNGSPITGFEVQVFANDQPIRIVPAAPNLTSLTIDDLSNGQFPYRFEVRAITSVGPGVAASSNPIIPAGRPFAAQSVNAAVISTSEIALSWVAPLVREDGTPGSNGSEIRWYTVVPSPACGSCTGLDVPGDDLAAARTTIRGLSPATEYQFTILATNSVGTSDSSAASDPETTRADNPPPVPLHPGSATNVLADFDNGQATVSWDPSDPSGSAILDYTVTAYRGDGSASAEVVVPGTQTTATVTGLSNTATYIFWVNARNAVGTSTTAWSSPSSRPEQLRGEADGFMALPFAEFLTVKSQEPPPFDWSDNGCSFVNIVVPEELNIACSRHDFGYRNYGEGLSFSPDENTRHWIDRILLQDLQLTCAQIRDGLEEEICINITSHAIYDAVRVFGGLAYG